MSRSQRILGRALKRFESFAGDVAAGPASLVASSKYGTHKTVTARFWPWLSGKNPSSVSSRSKSVVSCSLKSLKSSLKTFKSFAGDVVASSEYGT